MSAKFRIILVSSTLLAVLILSHLRLHSQSLEFFEESLLFKISGGFFTVDGQYYFRNTGQSDIHQILFYPFPADDHPVSTDSVSVTETPVTEEQLLVHRSEKGFSFLVQLKAGEEKAYHIHYRQKVRNHATYILTSTRHWGKPLEKAFYQLTVPLDIQIIRLSYPPDYQENNLNERIYYWFRQDFMPDRDFEIEF
ncbi:MAG TPA: hypothetical protein PK711_01165 [Bacteroidales bacterium]|nr:hypothetical protein [Bacteroidales bacterium]HRZ20104.1 hypothetical protein [Bacteroidales bacterium]